ncbi:protein translocase subunit SecD [Kineococcus sp. NUM-3379]
MFRAPLLRALLAAAVLAAALFYAVTTPARLGLDLRGGTQIVLETRSTDRVTADAETTDRTLEVLRGRVDALGVAEPTLTRAGERRIVVELPGLQDPREAAEVIGRTAQLTFHPVTGAPDPAAPAPTGEPAGDVPLEEREDLRDEDGRPLEVGPAAMTGEEVTDAAALIDTEGVGAWYVSLEFRNGGRAWEELTGQAACAPPGDPARRVAIALDGQVITSPQVDESLPCGAGIAGGSTRITGQFTPEEAQDLAALVKGGALPVPVEVIEQRTVGPTLGADAIDASLRAGIIGLLLTGAFITVVYRLAGFLATLALACYALISYAVLVALGATLTLPGLAGFVLAVGMAIDANVLVFERARERHASMPPASRGSRTALPAALATGFSRAWSAILDSNVTTLIAAGLLFLLASGPVRGFGVTLSIGVLASMFSALVIARVFTEWALRRRSVARHPGVSGISGIGRLRTWLEAARPQLMRRSRTWLALSAAVVVLAGTGIAVRGLNLGVEFTGGRLLQYSTSTPLGVEEARAAVAAAGVEDAVVQTSGGAGGAEDISVRTPPLSNEEAFAVEEALRGIGGEVTKERDELIGPSLGAELSRNALIALGVALAAQMLYLAVRFRWTMGLAAVLAMFHDVLAVVGVFAWLGKPVDGVFLAAALTVVGLSVNDTVVVFDRVRELRRARPGDTWRDVVDDAVLQTVPRTVNTGLGSMFVLAALLVLGGDTLADFALALLLGLVVGTFSSVFTASPLAIALEQRWPRRHTAAGAGTGSGDPADPYAFVDASPRGGEDRP